MITVTPADLNKEIKTNLQEQFQITNVKVMWEIKNHHQTFLIITVGKTNDE